MNLRRRRIRMVHSTLCAVAFCCVVGSVSAQVVHIRIDANGTTTYSDRADATPSPPAAAPALEAADAPARKPRISVRQKAVIEANEAARRLKQVRLTRQRSAEPLPGEWARGSDAGTVNHRYWRRQDKLRRDVEYALRRSNETHRSLQASR